MTYDTLFEIELKKLVSKHLDSLIDRVTTPAAVGSYDGYMKLIGEIVAFRDILPELCAETNSIIAKR